MIEVALQDRIKHAIAARDGKLLEDLARELSSREHLVWGMPQDDTFEAIAGVATALAGLDEYRLSAASATFLLDTGGAYWLRSRYREALALARRTIVLAFQANLDFVLRRAYNGCSANYIELGLIQEGLMHALHAAVIAEQIGDELGLFASIGNVTYALINCGLYRECLAVSEKINARPGGGGADRAFFLWMINRNAGSAARALGDYERAASLTRSAASYLRTSLEMARPTERYQSAANQAREMGSCEFSLMRVAYDTHDLDEARQHLKNLREVASKCDAAYSARLFALADIYDQLCNENLDGAVSKLNVLQELPCVAQSDITECLQLLIEIHEKRGDKKNVLLGLGQLIELTSKYQTTVLSRYLELIGQGLITAIPGKDDAKFIARIETSGSHSPVADQQRASDLVASLMRLAVMAELREDASGRHAYRVGRLARLFAEAIGGNAEYAESIEHAARLHDIGKLGLPDEVILNAGKLLPEQHQAMQLHCEIGAKMIDLPEHPELAPAREVVMSHHERWDGTGYPQKLKGEAIPLSARIASIAEVYDALTHERTYREGDARAYSHEAAVSLMQSLAGKQFDPSLMPVFVNLINELKQQHGDDLDDFLAIAGNDSAFLQAKDEMARLVDSL